MRTHRLCAALTVLVTVVALAACGSSAKPNPGATRGKGAFPATITDSYGKVTIPARPTRIFSLSPSGTEMLYAIGAGSQVVGVDKDSDYPAQAPRTSIDPLNVSAEGIATYHPDLVVLDDNSTQLIQQLAKLKIPAVYDPAANTLDDTYTEIDRLGVATGRVQAAGSLVQQMRSQIAQEVARVHPKAPNLTSYWEIDPTYYTVTSHTFIGQLLSMAGAHDIADSAPNAAGGYPQLSAEAIIHANPDLIFLSDGPGGGGQSAATVKARSGWSAIRAVQTNEIITLNVDVASRWGPRVVQLFTQIVDAVDAAPAPPG